MRTSAFVLLLIVVVQVNVGKSWAEEPDLAAVLELAPGDYTVVKPQVIIKLCSVALANKAKHGPDLVARLYEIRGDAYYELGQYEAAKHDYDNLVRLSSDIPAARLKRGRALLSLGLYHKALGDYREVVRLRPTWGKAYIGLAFSLHMTGQLDAQGMIKYFTKAIHADPNCALAYYDRGVARGGFCFDFMKAKQDLDRRIALDPRGGKGEHSVYGARAIVMVYLDQPDKGLRDAQLACQLSPSTPNEKLALWLCYYSLGKYYIARHIAQKAIELHPKFYASYQAYSAVKLVEGNLKDALAAAQKAVVLAQASGDYPMIIPHLANVYLEMGQFAKAREYFDRALADDIPNNPFALAGEAYLLSACPDKQFRDGRKALALAERASRCFHDKHPRYVMLRAMAHAECGEFGKAVELAKLALKLCRPDFDFRPQYERLLHQFERRVPHRWVQGCKTFDFFRY
jgi:tetratricopeptide (TPR) repeat protein